MRKSTCFKRFCWSLRYGWLVCNPHFRLATNNARELNIFKPARTALFSSFCGVFKTQRDNFLVFNLVRVSVTSYSWVKPIQQDDDDPTFLTPFYIFQQWKCQTQLISGHSVLNKDTDKSSASTEILDTFTLVSNGWNGRLTNGVSFIGVIGAVWLAVAEPGLGNAGFPVMTVKLPYITQDGVWDGMRKRVGEKRGGNAAWGDDWQTGGSHD